MTGLDYFAWVVFITIIVAALAIVVALCKIPGKIAKDNNHPQAEAINVAGWLGLLLSFGVIWVIAIIWAKTKPVTTNVPSEIEDIKASIAQLQKQLEAKQGDDAC
ncbi:DUF3302 domain-containing protein [Thalassotalea sp. LPB0316]|uniref:DUF3302 domain-containing protein n=1 Tax=Thalassotalea sp. LPB0316 TaxID=2769490 RepID=UPI001865BBC2|nr:DUF3302 domain-containing protein [Thalassotalea sp. LPB0316]QOL27180.1 DUF3302 domain-containing protein [Thalassotalea sp. LPB0316]